MNEMHTIKAHFPMEERYAYICMSALEPEQEIKGVVRKLSLSDGKKNDQKGPGLETVIESLELRRLRVAWNALNESLQIVLETIERQEV